MPDSRYKKFFTIDLLKKQIQAEFNKKAENLDQDDPFCFSNHESLSRKLEEDLEAIQLLSKKRKRKFNSPSL